jgi:hypothetical protein
MLKEILLLDMDAQTCLSKKRLQEKWSKAYLCLCYIDKCTNIVTIGEVQGVGMKHSTKQKQCDYHYAPNKKPEKVNVY